MMAAMGFGGFGTTKGKKVEDASQLGYAKVKQERTWRQYMNRYVASALRDPAQEGLALTRYLGLFRSLACRKGGFNRILDKID